MPFHTLVFDLDGTLYPRDNSLYDVIMTRIGAYLQRAAGLSAADAQALRRRYFVQYGTALRGLMSESQVDAEEFLYTVHDIDIQAYLGPDPALAALLRSLPQRKLIFTNASREHAGRVLETLGVADCFESILDVRAMDFRPKPDPLAYQFLARHLSPPFAEVLYLDDEPRNLPPAADLGLTTALVNPTTLSPDPRIHHIPDLFHLDTLLNHSFPLPRSGATH